MPLFNVKDISRMNNIYSENVRPILFRDMFLKRKSIKFIMIIMHLIGGPHRSVRLPPKILKSGYYWQSFYKDSHEFVKKFMQC